MASTTRKNAQESETGELRVVFTVPEGPVTITIQFPRMSSKSWYDLSCALGDHKKGGLCDMLGDAAVPESELAAQMEGM
jgi:hypothetical protein